MFRTVEIIHIRRRDEIFGRLQIPGAHGPAPDRSRIMIVRLQDEVLALQGRTDRPSDIADRDREDALPARALGSRVAPAAGQGVLGAGGGGVGIVGVARHVVGVEGGVDDVRDRDAWVVGAGVELVRPRRRGHPSPLVRGRGHDVVFLPVVEIPRFPVPTDAVILRTGSDALSIATGASAHDEDFLRAPELVDGLTGEKGIHRVDESNLVDAGEGEEEAAFKIGTDIARGFKIVAVHEEVIRGDIGFHRFENDLTQDATKICTFLKGVILTTLSVSPFEPRPWRLLYVNEMS